MFKGLLIEWASPRLAAPVWTVLWGETPPCVVMEKQFRYRSENRRLTTPKSLETFVQLKQTSRQPLCCSDELFFFHPCWRTNWWNDEMRTACQWTSNTFCRLGTGLQAVSEQSPSDISKVPTVSEEDDVPLSVKQCGDNEGLSLACLQENTETTFTKLFIRVLLLTCSSAGFIYNILQLIKLQL